MWRKTDFSKSSALWVTLLVTLIGVAVLVFVYVQGGLSHTVHQ